MAALALAVTLVHLWLADRALPDTLGEGAAAARPPRIDVAFVRELAPAQPAPTPPARGAPPPPRNARAAARPASTPAELAQVPEPPPEGAVASLSVTEPVPPLPAVEAAVDTPLQAPVAAGAGAGDSTVAEAASPSPAAAASVPAGAAGFEWPPSTRLSYRLSGYFRGPVEGQARVEWLRSGQRYQVHMDVGVGPSFAPLLSRRVSSEGEITAQGLRPDRYDEETRALLRDPRRQRITMGADTVRLPGGTELPRPPGLQDSASQFVQLTWLFTTQPQRLQPGRSVDFPLALPRQVEVWTYDVLASTTLQTPAGPVEAVHVKPRREPRPGADLTAEVWFAPSLQYLPVRILIRQDAENFIDLLIERLPQQAERER